MTATIEARPLGAESLVWQLGFARTALLYAGRALVLQVAHPVVGAGVRDFSNFRADPWGRLDRTIESLLRQMFGGDELVAEAARLRELHRTIKGVGFAGERYSALQPEAWAWVHMSNFDSSVQYFDGIVRPLTLAEKRALFQDWRRIGLVLGIKDHLLPAAYDDVPGYVDATVADRLVPNETCTEVLESLRLTQVGPPYRAVPAPVWAALKPVGRTVLHDFTIGTLPLGLRERLGLRWTDADERRLERTKTVVRVLSKAVPDRLMHYRPAYRAMRAARAAA